MRHENQLTIVEHFRDWIDDLRLAIGLLTRVPMAERDLDGMRGLEIAQFALPTAFVR